ncbi:MAG: hypothetical protein JO159_04620 [Acidobacteria bacterium]|nr:hypothetical protein [Acidobacteriota bacterium]MBV9625375.1 hypothetical protein [Acidobacteriota bacterium]
MTSPMKTAILCCWVMIAGISLAQTPVNNAPSPVSYSSISELNQMVANLQQTSQALGEKLSHLRIDKWKTDSATKRQTQNDTESILRNLKTALPSILADLKGSPESLPLTFKLYRNLDALYDVAKSVAESTGAFGSKEEFQSLSRDLSSIEDSRRAFAERIDKLAAAKETEIGQLRTELQSARAAIPPKKVVVDDTEPAPKKTPARKKSTPKPQTASQGSNQPTPSQPQSR